VGIAYVSRMFFSALFCGYVAIARQSTQVLRVLSSNSGYQPLGRWCCRFVLIGSAAAIASDQ
jgi:hypothetical protein